jgi:prepilin-type N-terminal cleavage/methylation domain-containing protein
MSNKFKTKGFTLVEVMAALFVIMVGMASFATLINSTVSYMKSSSYNLVAAYLGKEGIEIVKNIRDSNFLKVHYGEPPGATWLDGLSGCETGCQGDYSSASLSPYLGTPLYLKSGC